MSKMKKISGFLVKAFSAFKIEEYSFNDANAYKIDGKEKLIKMYSVMR